ncbi:MAG TPA: DUF6625 family protein, partial [Desulfitobacteriaceae bacterium]|nr:DUF6625 family protein [Desulfitobacteriaceae bacterium]
MNKICVASVYFGNLPESYPAWRRSCLANTTIDFLLLTDQNSDHREHNIQTVSMAFADFTELARQKLEMNIVLTTAYKCCDYKPVYGLILEDYLTGYDYWGYCDMDLVFGDLAFFFEREQLYSYDKFLPLGHLCLYRNTQECNNRYKLECNISNDYKTTFSTAENLLFDEREGIKEIYSTYGFSKYDQRIFADID